MQREAPDTHFYVEIRDFNLEFLGLVAEARQRCHGPVFGLDPAVIDQVGRMNPAQLEEMGASIVLSNAYHLAQRPGIEVVQTLGGVHGLMGWRGPILTDSGGFQVMSLAALVQVTDEGVQYRSHVDGRRGLLRPEDAVAGQEALGVDVAMSLDECVPAGASPDAVARAVVRTTAWAAPSQTIFLVPPSRTSRIKTPPIDGRLDFEDAHHPHPWPSTK